METADGARWTAAVGRNADHYLKHFQKIGISGRRWIPGWNFAAFLHSTAWFWYRRMYGWALINFFAPWILLSGLLFVGAWLAPHGNLDMPALWLAVAYLILVFVVVPIFADSLYYRHLEKRWSKIRPPSLWTGLGASAMVLAYLGLFLGMLVPASGGYTPRAKMSEAILAASAMRTEVTEFYQREGRFPTAEEARKFDLAAVSKYVESIAYDAPRRAIVVITRQPFPGKRIELYAIEETGRLAWRCRGIGIDKKNLPGTCRD